MTQSERAKAIATRIHEGQVDKAGAPYIEHPARIVARLLAAGAPDEALAVGWLHDVVEDSGTSLDDLRNFGFSDEVVTAVDAITKRDDESRTEYYARVAANDLAYEVKIVDIADNADPVRLALLDDATRDRLTQKYEVALQTLAEFRIELS